MRHNIILNADAYKASHFTMLDPSIKYSSSYIEARKPNQEVVFFGLQYLLKEYLSAPITKEDIDEASEILDESGVSWNREGWEYILQEHNGVLPIEIEAVKEGSIISSGNVLLQITNTDQKLAWLPSYLETMLLRLWYPCTVASVSHNIRKRLKQEFDFENPYFLNDFGSRGVSSYESSALGGSGHLIVFDGSDNIPAVKLLKDYYSYEAKYFSVNATEHSVTTSWNRENEFNALENWLLTSKDNILSVVIDSYDDMNFVNEICTTFKDIVSKRSAPLVLRPDSGIPKEIVLKVLNRLSESFEFVQDSKGRKLLPPYLRIIQGDGVNEESIFEICNDLIKNNYSLENVIFGMGGELLQKINRDSLSFAMKCSEVTLKDGSKRDVFKDPISDKGKKSKKGRLALIRVSEENNAWKTIREEELGKKFNFLRTIFKNGILLWKENFNSIKYTYNNFLSTIEKNERKN